MGKVMHLEEIQTECHYLAREKGFWDGRDEKSIPAMLALIHSEISEALEAYREGDIGGPWYYEGKPEGFGVELADAIIRILDLAEGFNIDLAKLIRIKLEYNKTRPQMHGKRC